MGGGRHARPSLSPIRVRQASRRQAHRQPEARLEGAASVGPDRVLPLWSLFRVVGKAEIFKKLLKNNLHSLYLHSSFVSLRIIYFF